MFIRNITLNEKKRKTKRELVNSGDFLIKLSALKTCIKILLVV